MNAPRKSSASQEITRIFYNTKVHNCIHKFQPPAPILSQINPVHAPPHIPYLEDPYTLVTPSTHISSKWSLSIRFPYQNHLHASPFLHTYYNPHHFIILGLIILMKFGEDYRSSSFSPCSLFHSFVTSPLLGPNISLSTLFSNTIILSSFFNVRDKFSHQCQKQAKLYDNLPITKLS